jgi:hypothetical protein
MRDVLASGISGYELLQRRARGTPAHQKPAFLARRQACADGILLYDRCEHHEAQRSDGERGETRETQNVFHISSYPFSISRRTGASAAGSVANSDAAGFS